MTYIMSSPLPDYTAALAAVARIRALHQPDHIGFCSACDYGYPCDTIKALDETEES